MPRGGKIAALGSSSYSSGPSTSREAHSTEVTSTVASMLQELQSLIKQTQVGGKERALNRVTVLTFNLLTQEERENGEQTLVGIRKTHEKMKNELRGKVGWGNSERTSVHLSSWNSISNATSYAVVIVYSVPPKIVPPDIIHW